jgi:hypothetical protein
MTALLLAAQQRISTDTTFEENTYPNLSKVCPSVVPVSVSASGLLV